ncbi:MAG: AI-2E family transporter, partial [Coprobacillaceae bacterium]
VFRFIMDPIVSYFHKINRKVVCAIVYASIILLFFALLYVVIPSFVKQCLHIYTNYDLTNLDSYIHPFFKPIYDFLVSIKIFDILLNMLQTAMNGVMYWGSNLLIAFGISFYLVLDDVSICRLIGNSKIPHKEKIITTLKELKQITYSFFKASFLDFLVFFIGSYVAFYLIGLDFLLYISVFLAITNLIPYIGPFIGGIPVIVYGFTLDTSIGYMCVLAVLILQVVESNFIQPMLFRKCLSTNPIILIIALSIFGDWFGIMGMIVAPLILGYIVTIKNVIKVETTS